LYVSCTGTTMQKGLTSLDSRNSTRLTHETTRPAHETKRPAHETKRPTHETKQPHETTRLNLRPSRRANAMRGDPLEGQPGRCETRRPSFGRGSNALVETFLYRWAVRA